ncbi:KH homology domain-containing protein 4-like isoform X2 [Argiope bruennichi]|uniref:KH homology domain-containing protein 4-like isoform X2 n=1 Tax=Argiope bruennichi TaxID=94029 RepID=UPI00249540D1|nr:KH homology domain-containing protein 4-like isoform X2 [Argiope bruennichi]
MSKSSLEAAAEAAAKVNAMLIAKGKLKLSSSQIKPKIGNNFANNRSKIAGDLVTAEVDINDAPLSARNLLTRGHMQDEICKLSGAAISTRGRYMTPEERQNIATPECRPLYLNVQASSFEAVKVAVRRIQEIIDQEVLSSGLPKSPTVGVVTYPQNCTNGTVNTGFQANHVPTGSHFVQDKVFIGLEQAPSEYPVREKILGPGGSFLQHIRSETGASVMLRGKGSGFLEPTSGREAFEPLYIHITHPKPEGLQAAKALAINLVETAHVEFAQWQQAQQQSVLQPLTSIVLPQATPVAYQNQGTTLTTGIPSLIHASMPTLVSPVSVVSSVPMSVQAISPTVISYPTYVANTNSIIARPANPVLARPAAPAVSILSVVPTLPTGAAYTSARPRPAYQIQPVVYTNVPPLQPANLAQSPMPATSMVVTLTEPTNYPVQSRFTHPPPITQSELAKHRYFSNMNISVPSSVNTAPTYCLQESNVNHPTELQPRRGPSNPPQQSDPQDRELMPPPPTTLTSTPSSAKEKEVREFSPEDEGQQRKRLKGALGGIASIYGSDDSDEEDEEDTLASKS